MITNRGNSRPIGPLWDGVFPFLPLKSTQSHSPGLQTGTRTALSNSSSAVVYYLFIASRQPALGKNVTTEHQ